jgi:hypothetical protein
MHIDFSKHELFVLIKALEKAGTLDSEINLAKTSKAAKGTACMKEPRTAIDKKLRIREPWWTGFLPLGQVIPRFL